MTEKYQYSARELVTADSGKSITTCQCLGACKTEHTLCLNVSKNTWFIELPMIRGGKKFFEIGLYAFCPHCCGFEYAYIPTPSDGQDVSGYVYIVNEKNRPKLVTRNRAEAISAYVELLKSFCNPFGEQARREASINMSEFY